jgi:microcystin-dependent protein
MDASIGDIRFVIGDNPPPDYRWAFCDGKLVPIAQYPALASILQGIFGGDMKTTVALPDLRCSIPPGSGAANFIIYIGPPGQQPDIEPVGVKKRKPTKKRAAKKTSKKSR